MADPSEPPALTGPERQRYARHLLLPHVGEAGQRRLKASRVLVVGSGGLGSPALMYLAAAGVGTLGIIDHDRVDASNLQRQLLHTEASLGQPKVDSARERLEALNPLIEIITHDTVLRSHNALELLQGWDLIIDGTDNFPTRYLINDACEMLGSTWVYGSIFQFEGQVSVFNAPGGPNYRDLFPEPPPPGMVPSCAEGGVLGILPGVIGSLQATEAVKLLLEIGEPLVGRLLVYDALTMEVRTLRIVADAEAVPVAELIDYEAYCGVPVVEADDAAVLGRAGSGDRGAEVVASDASSDGVKTDERGGGAMLDAKAEAWMRGPAGWADVPPQDVVELREAGAWEPYVLDVRDLNETAIADLDFKDRLLPVMQIMASLDELPKDRDLLVYCRSGSRSAQVCEALSQLGFEAERLHNLSGGLLRWSQDVDPTMARY